LMYDRQCLYKWFKPMQTRDVAREKLFNMRLSHDEAERLDRLAAHYGLNAAGVIRMLLKREDDSLLVPRHLSGIPKRRKPSR